MVLELPPTLESTCMSHVIGDIASGGSGSCTVQIKCSAAFTTAPSITLMWVCADAGSSSSSSSSSSSLRLLLPCTPLMLLEPRSISNAQSAPHP